MAKLKISIGKGKTKKVFTTAKAAWKYADTLKGKLTIKIS